ncbi:hypothetical protein MRB53_019679 [Persea americana]|uniref:Uncharacterized protein n=1 Tax=Persea americana TaxID=3435 RepID=A0ACC2KZX4_PERAE|nr:hypothetical protein MRB53_019679 [Persea americana]
MKSSEAKSRGDDALKRKDCWLQLILIHSVCYSRAFVPNKFLTSLQLLSSNISMDKPWLGELQEDIWYWIFSHYCGLRDCIRISRIAEKAWTPVTTEIEDEDVLDEYVVHDVIYHKGQFYAVSMHGSVGVLHINSARPDVEILSETITVDDYPRTYLLADSVSESLIILERISPPSRS